MKKIALFPIIAGLALGIIAPLLVKFGNPANMGVCAACFTRDIAGGIGLQSAIQYIRPEIIGLIFGAFLSAFIFKEFRPRGGSTPIARFFLGIFAMIGALVFLGCPWRMILRLSAGDLSALAGLFGLIVGIYIGIIFLKKGFSLGRNYPQSKISGALMPLFALILFVLLLAGSSGVIDFIKFSTKGPGSMHAPLLLSLAAGLIIGILFQKSRFCMIAAVRDTIIIKNGGTSIVQCKHWHNQVGPRPVRELWGCKDDFKADEIILVASSGITRKAEEFISNKPNFKVKNLDDIINMSKNNRHNKPQTISKMRKIINNMIFIYQRFCKKERKS